MTALLRYSVVGIQSISLHAVHLYHSCEWNPRITMLSIFYTEPAGEMVTHSTTTSTKLGLMSNIEF